MTEMVPEVKTVDNWTEMVITQIFLGLKDATTEQFQALSTKAWLDVCKDGKVAPVIQKEENGHN